jgi:hypothetical protein
MPNIIKLSAKIDVIKLNYIKYKYYDLEIFAHSKVPYNAKYHKT